MTLKHVEQVPRELETVIAQLQQLEVVLGKQVAPAVKAIRAALFEAMAARDRGDVPAAVDHIGSAMDYLTALADKLDPAEAVLMRALAQSFRAALRRGDDVQAQQSTRFMLEKSGGAERQDK